MIDTFYRAVGDVLSPKGKSAHLSILIYHRVLPHKDDLLPYEVTAELFGMQLDALRNVFNVLPLGEAIDRLKSGTLPPRSACITFDDGYADNATIALPILKRHNLPATFFIAADYLNGGRMFNDTVIHAVRHCRSNHIDLTGLGFGELDFDTPEAKRLAIGIFLKKLRYEIAPDRRDTVAEDLAKMITDVALPTDLMMDTRQIRELVSSGMEIGGHTMSHPILARISLNDARREIADGKEYLEHLLGTKLKVFAYPNGRTGVDYTPDQAALPHELGFAAAVTTCRGSANQRSDIFQLPRFTPYTPDIKRFAPMLLQNIMASRFNFI